MIHGIKSGGCEKRIYNHNDIDHLENLLNDRAMMLGVIREETIETTDKYADERRSQIIPAEGEFRMEDIIANEGCIITVSHKGFIKPAGVI